MKVKGLRLKPLLAVLGAGIFLFTWNLLSYSQVQLFFNKVFVAYDSSDPQCTKDMRGSDAGSKSVSYIGAPASFNALINSSVPATIAFNPAVSAQSTAFNYPGSCLHLCTQLGYSNKTGANIPIDTLEMDVFKFLPGIDPASAPPVRTFTFSAIGQMLGTNNVTDVQNKIVTNNTVIGVLPFTSSGNDTTTGTGAYCVGWDGSYNVEGEFGRTNGQYGFRVKANVHQQSPTQGNITIETSPPGIYPGEELTADTPPKQVGQAPITMDVVDIHVVRSTPSVVGLITGVTAEPYNIQYRLSKDATAYITIVQYPSGGGSGHLVRSIIAGLPRVGEGIPNGGLTNGDFWDGRNQNGDIMPPGVYNFLVQAVAQDQFGAGLSSSISLPQGLDATPTFASSYSGADFTAPVIRQIGIDPLQITDIRVNPLLDGATALATISYLLTENATAFVDIYPPGTTFNSQNGIMTDFNALDGGLITAAAPSQMLTLNSSTAPVRTITEQKMSRVQVLNYWDGRNSAGRVLEDGDYPFLLYAQLPSAAGKPWGGTGVAGSAALPPVVWTSRFQTGFLSIARGMPGITQIAPQSGIIGSSPPVAGLNPFNFSYALTRDSIVSLKVFRATNTIVGDSTALVKTLVNQETRPAGITNTETWSDIYDDHGLAVSSGVYVVQLTAQDPYFSSKVATVTASFPIDLFRVTNLSVTPLLAGASDQALVNYELTQPMNVTLAFYPPGTTIDRSGVWPPCGSAAATSACAQVTTPSGAAASAIKVISGMRPGRMSITESWDGRAGDGSLVPDGSYPFTLVAQSTSTPSYFASDRVTGSVTIARGQVLFSAFQVLPTIPSLANSSATVSLPPFEIDYVVSRQSSVTVQALTTTLPVTVARNILSGGIRDAGLLNKEFWDGRDDSGNFVPPGFYTLRVVAQDLSAQLIQGSTEQTTVAVDPLRIYDVAVGPVTLDNPAAEIAYQVSEGMKVAIKIYKPGTSFDVNGNPVPSEATSLVRHIVGVKPARTPIRDFWDGRDSKLSLVPDGNYVFRIVASTDISAIDSFTGAIRPGALLAEDVITSELSVVRGGSSDPEQDFLQNTIAYPNPARDPTVTFQIWAPVQANAFLRIYNLAGELVRDESLGPVAGGQQLDFVWKKDNSSGHPVAHGVYFAVIREEASAGDATVLQTVKKILIP